jgi:magnesium chelatase family protein
MSREEMIQSTEIHSVAGLTSRDNPIMAVRPFRSPHHTISAPAIAGGTSIPKPGEISLAHNGVLFLDELPEFNREVLECLRQPIEDGQVTISRAATSVTYPSSFMLVCAMNPCKCGWYGHISGKCQCSSNSVSRYHERLSGPLLDRMDLYIEAPSLEYGQLRERSNSETSAAIRMRVNNARNRQRIRLKGTGIDCNAHIGTKLIEAHCSLTPDCEKLMHDAYEKLSMTARSYDRTMRVARTIADLDSSVDIKIPHLAEAISYRRLSIFERL